MTTVTPLPNLIALEWVTNKIPAHRDTIDFEH